MIKAKYALVCEGIPNSLINGLSLNDHEPVDLKRASEEHKQYIDVLEQSGLSLFKIQPNELYPDCVFVEDTAIALQNRIFVTNSAVPSRRGEHEQVRATFESVAHKLNLQIGEIKNKQDAFIDGGDCLFTGRELIVGLSTRTNLNGVRELEEFFKDTPVIVCTVAKNLHLKSIMTMLDDDTILIASGVEGESLFNQIQSKSTFFKHYKFIEVPSEPAANVLSFNGKILAPAKYRAQCEHIPQLVHNSNVVWLENSEFEKIDGCLTCRSVFFNDGN